MEKKANAKIMGYVDDMQTNIISKIKEGMPEDELIHYIQNYSSFSLETKDFT